MDTCHTATVTNDAIIYGIDFGTGDALAIYGPDGPVSRKLLKLPRKKPGEGKRTPADEFPMMVEALFIGNSVVPAGDVVVESPTIGSSGCETATMIELLGRYPDRKLYTISPRACKNYRKDHDLGWAKGARYAKDGDEPPVILTLEQQKSVHVEEAEIIWKIATHHPERLYHWTGPSFALERLHTSVRPMDKRGYDDERAQRYMQKAPAFNALPAELQSVFGVWHGSGRNKHLDYSRSSVMPFIMATEEPHLENGPPEDRRRRYEKVIGLYDRGYPSFYRRAAVSLMQTNAKAIADVTKIEEVTPEQRKEAWKVTQRQIRWFFHLMMDHQGRS